MTSSPAPARRSVVGGGALVAAGMIGMNATIYVFNVVAARLMLPREFGALTALFGVILIGNVVSLALQAVTARHLAVSPPERHARVVATTARVTLALAVAVGALVAASTVVMTPVLRLDSPVPVVLCGATLVPLTIMGAQSGVAQGTGRWTHLMLIYLANGIGRLLGGVVAVLVDPSVTSAMVGVAVGAWAPVVVGSRLLRLRGVDATGSRAPFVRETVLGSHALLAYFVLSNLDSLIARNRFDAHDAGLYAAGLILAKAALFMPQFVSVVLFPDLARDHSRRARLRAVAAVAGLGVLAVGATALLPRLALVLAGGEQYAEVSDRLWLFALAGSVLAIVHLLVFDAIARHAHGIVVLLWIACALVLAVAYGLDVHVGGLVTTVAGVAVALAAAVWVAAGGRGEDRTT